MIVWSLLQLMKQQLMKKLIDKLIDNTSRISYLGGKYSSYYKISRINSETHKWQIYPNVVADGLSLRVSLRRGTFRCRRITHARAIGIIKGGRPHNVFVSTTKTIKNTLQTPMVSFRVIQHAPND